MLTPLSRIEIAGFRGIRSTRLLLHPRVTVLFGANAAGKTSVLDALAIGLGPVVSRMPKVKGRGFKKTGDLRVPFMDRPRLGERAGVEVPDCTLKLGPFGLAWSVSTYRSEHDRRIAGDKKGVKALHEALDPLIKAALELRPDEPGPVFPLVAYYGNQRAVVDVPLRERSFAKEFRRFEAYDGALNANTRFKSVFEWFRLMEDEERRQRERHADPSFVLPELYWVREAVRKAELRCEAPRVETRPIRMMVDFLHEGGGREALDITQLSDGFRTHFSLVVDLARRMAQLNPSPMHNDEARGTSSPAVVLIDEIDLHLDPQWQARVVRGLLAAFPNTQFVMTTHSEQVLGSVEAECVRQLYWEEGEIQIKSVPFAQGATGERILMDLMGAPERVPGPITDKIREYAKRVSDGRGASDEAQRLRAEIEAAVPHDPVLRQTEFEMQRQALQALGNGGARR